MKKTMMRVRRFFYWLRDDQRGDSFAEALVAMLIAVMGATLLATMAMASSSAVSASHSGLLDSYRQEAGMHQDTGASASVKIACGKVAGDSIKVKLYVSEDGSLIRYADEQYRSEDLS